MESINWKRMFFFLIIISSIFLLAVKILYGSNVLYIVSTFLFESGVYVLIFIVYLGFFKVSHKVANILFILLFLVHTLVVFLSSYFMSDLFGRGVSLFSINLGTINFTLNYVLPWKYLVYIFCFFIFSIFLSYLFSKYFKKCPSKKLIYPTLLLSIFLIIFIPIIFGNNFESIYVNTVFNINLFSSDIIVMSQDYNCNLDYSFFEKDNYPDLALQEKYKKIVVFVMESVIYSDFENYLSKTPSELNFFEITKSKSQYYYNYYTNNQDSSSAIITMLSSIFVPNEAYIYTDAYSLHGHSMMNKYNLIDYFNHKNYYTAFYSSARSSNWELTAYDWDNLVNIKDKYDEYDKNYLCFNPYFYDTACEDFVIFDELVNDLNKDNFFILQELTFGHNYLYIEKSGMQTVEYYNKYFLEFYNKIKEQNLDDDLLIIIVSDHGLKSRSHYTNTNGYNIPLIFIANDLTYSKNMELLSHMDFKDILFNYIYGLDYNSDNAFYLVGPTGHNILGYLDESNDYIVEQKNETEFIILDYDLKGLKLHNLLSCFLKYKGIFNDNY